jgi:hypothetical protein
MVIYTVTIPIKKEVTAERMRGLMTKHGGEAESKAVELQDGENAILAYRTEQGEFQIDLIFVEAKDRKRLTVSLNAPCERAAHEIVRSIPRIVKALYDEKPFPIEPHYLTCVGSSIGVSLSPDFKGKVINMICGKGQGALPMVYISKLPYYDDPDNKEYIVSPDRLAQLCSGIACVVKEDEKGVSYELSNATEKRSPIKGFIRVYYPHVGVYDSFATWEAEDAETLEYKIFDVVRKWWLNSAEHEYTWSRLQLIKERQLATNEKGAATALIAAFEADMESAIDENTRLKNELETEKNKRVAAERERDNLQLRVQNKSKGCLIEMPEIDEWYVSEFTDTILGILKHTQTQLLPENRAAEIIDEILRRNPILGKGDELFEELRRDMLEADSTEKLINAMKRHGFVLISEAPHNKLHYRGNPRYFATIANSPSDKRQKENTISDIMKKINPNKGI